MIPDPCNTLPVSSTPGTGKTTESVPGVGKTTESVMMLIGRLVPDYTKGLVLVPTPLPVLKSATP